MAVVPQNSKSVRKAVGQGMRREDILSKIPGSSCMPQTGVDILRLLHAPGIKMGDARAAVMHVQEAIDEEASSSSATETKAHASLAESHNRGDLRVGMQCMVQMATAWAIAPLAQMAIKSYDMTPKEMIEHALNVRVAVAHLGASLGLDLPEYVFVAALFHDIGKIVLGSFVGVDASRVISLASQADVSLESAERKLLGIDHAEVGAVLLENWRLPKCIVNLVRRHHLPDSAPQDQTAVDVLHAADALCMTAIGEKRNAPRHYHPSLSVTDRLGLSTKSGQKAVLRTLNELEKTASLFDEH